jgi:sugar/nucleoside kinase (ribokinase family)
VLLGPVCGEVPAGLGTAFSGGIVGVAAQGWLRRLDRSGRVRRRAWTGEAFWSGGKVLFASEEDLGRRREQVDRWRADVPVVVVTRDRRGARVHAEGARVLVGGRWRAIEAFPANEVDPTGAGDVFAAAFLVRYHETEDIAESARFASAAGACSVEAPGSASIATRDEIEARMEGHKEIVLR